MLHTGFQQLSLRQADNIPDNCSFGRSCCESEKEFLIKQVLLCHQLRSSLSQASCSWPPSLPEFSAPGLPQSSSLLVLRRHWLGPFLYGAGDQQSFFFFFFNFWLGWVFVAACGFFLQLRLAGATLCCVAQASHCSGFSCCGLQARRLQQLWLAGSRARAQQLWQQLCIHCSIREARPAVLTQSLLVCLSSDSGPNWVFQGLPWWRSG